MADDKPKASIVNLSRRQEIALRFLAAVSWTDHKWVSIQAALVMRGEKSCNGRVTADSLVSRGLATQSIDASWCYSITDKGQKWVDANDTEVKRA